MRGTPQKVSSSLGPSLQKPFTKAKVDVSFVAACQMHYKFASKLTAVSSNLVVTNFADILFAKINL